MLPSICFVLFQYRGLDFHRPRRPAKNYRRFPLRAQVYMWATKCGVAGDFGRFLGIGGAIDINSPCYTEEGFYFNQKDRADQICKRNFNGDQDPGTVFSAILGDPLPEDSRQRILEGMKELRQNASHSAIIIIKERKNTIPARKWKNLDKPLRRPDGTLIAATLEKFFRKDYILENPIEEDPGDLYNTFWTGHIVDPDDGHIPHYTEPILAVRNCYNFTRSTGVPLSYANVGGLGERGKGRLILGGNVNRKCSFYNKILCLTH